jgi:hypothetical protein
MIVLIGDNEDDGRKNSKLLLASRHEWRCENVINWRTKATSNDLKFSAVKSSEKVTKFWHKRFQS